MPRSEVVRIRTTHRVIDPVRPYLQSPALTTESYGSAFFWQESTLLVTCYHCVHDARRVSVLGPDNLERATATVLGAVPSLDIALLRVEDESITDRYFQDFVSLEELHRRAQESLSMDVMCIGHPLGSSAQIASSGRITGHSGGLIQVDASFSPGSSGGPVLLVEDKKLMLVGIVHGSLTDPLKHSQNLNLVVPIDYLCAWKDRLVQQTPSLPRPRNIIEPPQLGIFYRALNATCGEALRTLIDQDSPVPEGRLLIEYSMRPEIKRGDLLIAIDGIPVAYTGYLVTPCTSEALTIKRYIETHKVEGSKVVLTVFRQPSLRASIMQGCTTLDGCLRDPSPSSPPHANQSKSRRKDRVMQISLLFEEENAVDTLPRLNEQDQPYVVVGGLVLCDITQELLDHLGNEFLWQIDVWRPRPIRGVVLTHVMASVRNEYLHLNPPMLLCTAFNKSLKTTAVLRSLVEDHGHTLQLRFHTGQQVLLDSSTLQSLEETVKLFDGYPRS